MKNKKYLVTASLEMDLRNNDCEMHAIQAVECALRSIKAVIRRQIFEYYREICYQCKGLGYINKKPCPLCKGYGLGKWEKS